MSDNQTYITCPFCSERIEKEAITCKHCYSIINEERFAEFEKAKDNVLFSRTDEERDGIISHEEISTDKERAGIVIQPKLERTPDDNKDIIAWQDGTYAGQLKDGKPHGQGLASGSDDTIYEGEWRDGKKHGKGFYIWPNPLGGKYVGEWRDDEINGQGLLEYNDGTIYVCEFKDGIPHGYGKMTSSGGFSYEGEFEEGKFHGQGTHIYHDPEYGLKYVGEFKKGKYHGRGTLYDKDGKIINEGKWFDGEFQG